MRRAGTGAACAVLAALSGLAGASAPPAQFDPSRSDPRAIVIADLAMAALGGRQAWEQTRFVYFAFAVERDGKRVAYRTHLWDRWEERLRYQTHGKDGTSFVVLMCWNIWRCRRSARASIAQASDHIHRLGKSSFIGFPLRKTVRPGRRAQAHGRKKIGTKRAKSNAPGALRAQLGVKRPLGSRARRGR